MNAEHETDDGNIVQPNIGNLPEPPEEHFENIFENTVLEDDDAIATRLQN